MIDRLFAKELRLTRERKGWTLEEAGPKLGYTGDYLQRLETGRKPPTREVAERADVQYGLEGLLVRIWEAGRQQDVIPDWFRAWPDIEQQAATIRAYEIGIMPGLLQTEAYARSLLRDEDRVTARMERQQVFGQPQPPDLVAILDESALQRSVGGPGVMHDQLQRLADPPATARVHVLPDGAETYLGVDGSFEIATLDGVQYVYANTPVRGFVLETDDEVAEAERRWDALSAEALPLRLSRDLILKVAEQWESKS